MKPVSGARPGFALRFEPDRECAGLAGAPEMPVEGLFRGGVNSASLHAASADGVNALPRRREYQPDASLLAERYGRFKTVSEHMRF